MKKEHLEKKSDLKKLKGFLDDSFIIYDKVIYDFKKGYCIISNTNKYILGDVFERALYKIACLISSKHLKFACMYNKANCPYYQKDNSCNLDFNSDCIFEAKTRIIESSVLAN